MAVHHHRTVVEHHIGVRRSEGPQDHIGEIRLAALTESVYKLELQHVLFDADNQKVTTRPREAYSVDLQVYIVNSR